MSRSLKRQFAEFDRGACDLNRRFAHLRIPRPAGGFLVDDPPPIKCNCHVGKDFGGRFPGFILNEGLSMFRHRALLLATLLILAATVPARAGFLPGFTGNSQTLYTAAGPSTAFPSSDGLINFSVYDNTNPGGPNGNWITDFATSYGVTVTSLSIALGLSGRESYVYLYQMVNTNPDPASESSLHLLQIEGGQFDGAGYLTKGGATVGFKEAAGVTGPVANPAIGTATTDGPTISGNVPGNHVPGFSGGVLSATAFDTAAGGKTPTGVTYLVGDNAYQFEFPNLSAFPPLTDHGLAPDGFSTVVFLTSERAPSYLVGTVHDGVFTQGDVPSNTPEPGTTITALGALACGIIGLIVKKAKK
jgi:hypothetical protein